MKTLHIELDVSVEEATAALYQKISKDINSQLNLIVSRWLAKYLHKLDTKPKVDKDWLDFLNNIDNYAVDTNIEDLSINHEYYLYGGTKRL